jgi:hypothetical protein
MIIESAAVLIGTLLAWIVGLTIIKAANWIAGWMHTRRRA